MSPGNSTAISGNGKGGVNRGRGDASLNFSGETQRRLEEFEAAKLPRGVVAPEEWELAEVSRAAPEVNPRRDRSGGSTGAAGSGEASSRRRLAPGRREVVRRFFTRESDGK